MYTQCPECEVTFHVTAEVLKQAAGKVRCGGCGVAFNSLAHLSEEMPARPVRSPADTEDSQSDADEPAELEAAVPPKAITAAQSAALLKTLDQLAGENVRIEDTGVEWRVISEDDAEPDSESDEDASVDDIGDDGAGAVRTEMRFDDNTPLPDDFDLDTLSTAPAGNRQPPTQPAPPVVDPHVDLAFGDAEDWGELLDDLETTSGILVEETNITAVDIEIAEESDAPLPDVDTQFAMLGRDLSGRHQILEAGAGEETVTDPAPDEYAEPEMDDEPDEEAEAPAASMDEDLFALAVAEDDGFHPALMVLPVSDTGLKTPEAHAEPDARDENQDPDEDLQEPDDDSDLLMESIIMEGESVHKEENTAQLEIDHKEALDSLHRIDARRRMSRIRDWRPPRHAKLAAAAVLLLVLIVQMIHHSREALATSPVFQATLAPVYRILGSPVTPAWDIRGWRFEATEGNTDDAGDVLTIYSRIGNTSAQSLPYPLLHVALTDRFEEVIGSRVLSPEEYLANSADPAASVQSRDNFNAVISIQSPSADATGFKLDVCYPLSRGRLRCAFESFR